MCSLEVATNEAFLKAPLSTIGGLKPTLAKMELGLCSDT